MPVLVLKREQVEAIADDLYRQDAVTYMPPWKAKDGWRDGRKNPIRAVERFMEAVNRNA